MCLDFLFQIWRRLSGPLQWWSLWLISSKFMVSVSGIVVDKNGLVLLLRHRHWVPDVWGFPGGIVKSGESLENAFAREVLEETGLVISDIELVNVKSGYKFRLEVYFRSKLVGQNELIILQEQEVIEGRFFPLYELPSNLLPLHKELIETSFSSFGG